MMPVKWKKIKNIFYTSIQILVCQSNFLFSMTNLDLKSEFELYLKELKEKDPDETFDSDVEPRKNVFTLFATSKEMDWKKLEAKCKNWWETRGYQSSQSDIVEKDSEGTEELKLTFSPKPKPVINTFQKKMVKDVFGSPMLYGLLFFALLAFAFGIFGLTYAMVGQNTFGGALSNAWHNFTNFTRINQTAVPPPQK